MSAPLLATYRVRSTPAEAQDRARAMALEQTVEVPPGLAPKTLADGGIVADVAAIEPTAEPGWQRVTLAFPAELANGQIPQLLNLLFGNLSIQPGIVLENAEFPDSLLREFRGPKYGGEGLRGITGIYERPLLATALKPRGASIEKLTLLAGRFAEAGGDLVKDDHNLAENSFAAFSERVGRCFEAVSEANGKSGRNCLYLPNIMAPAQEMERYIEFVAARGMPGVLVSPVLAGFDTVRYLAEKYPLLFMAHPAFSGSYYVGSEQGVAPEFFLGTLFRLLGCDISVFPNYGGRFSLTKETCSAIHHRLTAPIGNLRPAWPAPAGGMQLDRIPAMAETYGADAVYLVGGALLGHEGGVERGTRTFREAIRNRFGERIEPAAAAHASACDWPPPDRTELQHVLPFRGDFTWEGRAVTEYKTGGDLPFEGVKRIELVGKSGERTAYDVRYFEVAPHGYTSLEKHVHSHTIIGARGQGVLIRNGNRNAVRPFDVAYIDSLDVHQLRNEGVEPFGFFCIVDHERDRPQAP